MQYIILIGNEQFDLNLIRSIKHYECIKSYFVPEIKNRYCIDFGSDHIFYDLNNEIVNDFEDKDLHKIPYKSPNFIMMVYTSEDRMRKILKQENFYKDIYVDNDHGLIVPLAEFVTLGMPV